MPGELIEMFPGLYQFEDRAFPRGNQSGKLLEMASWETLFVGNRTHYKIAAALKAQSKCFL
jgi:hypothetical protein